MKKILLLALLAISSIGATQIPTDGDSIYYSPKYCNTAETAEDALTQWIWNGNVGDCIQPSPEFVAALWPGMWLLDTYECCCKVASTPGMESAWTAFEGSPCEEYLDLIGFTLINESDMELDGIYIDPFGIQYTMPPKGLSIMNKNKYYRFN